MQSVGASPATINNSTNISAADVDFSQESVIWIVGPLVHAAEVLREWRVRATPAVFGRLEGCCRFDGTEGSDQGARSCYEDLRTRREIENHRPNRQNCPSTK